MRVPRHWLHELVDVSDVPTSELAERLSHTGSAVDAVERFAPGVSGVVVGRVLDVQDAEGSDKLVISHVDVGEEKLTILAGAKNFNQGDVVPVAKVGARVTTLDVPIGRRRMMNRYESEGMLCSAAELGIDDDANSGREGILVLEEDVPLGADVATLLGLDDDVFEFEIYPNRPDQMSVLGIAREVALVYGRELRVPSCAVVEDGGDVATSVTIEDREGCPRYLARVIEGVTFGQSPALVRSRLTACGMRPLGNLVDITNYVLLLTGQPLHAFDMDLLAEQRIVVRRARGGETMRTLDGTERKLEAEDLVIADATHAQALAGVMGGATSEVSETTKRVLLESAYFEPIGIARTSRRHHLRSEASARFERGADPEMVPKGAAIAAEMFRTLAGGTVAKGVVDEGSAPARRTLALRPSRIETILGVDVPADEVTRIITGVGCDMSTGDVIDVVPPSWRPDLEREIDLIEEVARVFGYEKIPPALKVGSRGGRSDEQILRERVRETLIGAGLTEVTLQTFVSPEDIKTIGYDGDLVEVSNPMTEDQAQLRPSLFPGLLRAAQRNVARGIESVRLFEFGKLFRGWPQGSAVGGPAEGSAVGGPAEGSAAVLPDESEHVAFVLVGAEAEHWSRTGGRADAFDASGLISLVLGELGISGWTLGTDDTAPLFHPGRAADVLVNGVLAGRFGEVRPSVAKVFDLDAAVIGGLTLAPLFANVPEEFRVTDLATQPPALRDIAIALDEDVAAGEVSLTIREAGGEFLESVVLVDSYRGEQVGEGRKSLAFRLTFRAPDRTLTSEEVDAAREAIASAVAQAHEGTTR